MRKTFAILILGSFLLYVHGASVLWGGYVAYADDIAQIFCENPTITHCQGKCHIKKLEAQGQSEDSPRVPDIRAPEIAPIEHSVSSELPWAITDSPFIAAHSGHPLRGHPQGILHPPLVSVS